MLFFMLLINEWQTGQHLNTAVQQARRSDFALVLAMFSPDVRDSAEFYTPQPQVAPVTADVYQQLHVVPQREFGLQQDDLTRLQQQSQQFHAGGLASWRLHHLLQPEAWVLKHDAKKLDDEVLANLPLHCKVRSDSGEWFEKPQADATGLYEVLEDIHQREWAA